MSVFALPFTRPVVPVVRLTGVVGALPFGRRGLSLQTLERPLETAFAIRRAPAVALLVDCPGGSPAQSSLVARRIRELAEKREKRVLAFVEDVAASGGYWLACAADEIFADANSIVGSIGVISAGFGFQDAIARLGIERRVHARGPLKDFLDPFRPEDPAHVAVLEDIQAEIHRRFLDHVRSRRGGRLRLDDAELGSGRVWTGEAALAAGLVDGIGDLRGTLRARFGDRVRLRVVNPPRPGWLRGIRPDFPTETVETVAALLEERLSRARFGL